MGYVIELKLHVSALNIAHLRVQVEYIRMIYKILHYPPLQMLNQDRKWAKMYHVVWSRCKEESIFIAFWFWKNRVFCCFIMVMIRILIWYID